MHDRTELATFLRTRRGRLHPAEVGLPDTGRRRTPGLRRQEVAQLAGMSVEYYIRLEQARGPRPSGQILAALSRALMLTLDEREYLFRLAGENPPPLGGPSRTVGAGIRHLLDSMAATTPAFVVDAKYDFLTWNDLAPYFLTDLVGAAEGEPNFIRYLFSRPEFDPCWMDPDSVDFIRATVADLRAAYARYRGDRGISGLVTELLATSPRFAQMWATQDVQVRRAVVKKLEHPIAGHIGFECQVLHISDTDQRLVIFCAKPGSPTDLAFRRLAATGSGSAHQVPALQTTQARRS